MYIYIICECIYIYIQYNNFYETLIMKISFIFFCASFILRTIGKNIYILQKCLYTRKDMLSSKKKRWQKQVPLKATVLYFDANRFSYQEIVREYIIITDHYRYPYYYYYYLQYRFFIAKYFTVNMQTLPQGSSSRNFSRRRGREQVDRHFSFSFYDYTAANECFQKSGNKISSPIILSFSLCLSV